jgi:hypothetical protein
LEACAIAAVLAENRKTAASVVVAKTRLFLITSSPLRPCGLAGHIIWHENPITKFGQA